jgi:hypothetical protein
MVLSGADLTAQEFSESVLRAKTMADWVRRPNVTIKRLAHANHTFSTQEWRDQVHRWIREWLQHT